jgi:hypothetical protein
VATFAFAAACLLVGAAFRGSDGNMASVLVFTALPWFVVFRLLREIRGQRDALEASQVAEARTAAVAERGRLAFVLKLSLPTESSVPVGARR